MNCVFLENVVGLDEDPFLFGGETHFCYAKADFAPVKVNIGLRKNFIVSWKKAIFARGKRVSLQGKSILVRRGSQFGLGENGFCFGDFDSVSGNFTW